MNTPFPQANDIYKVIWLVDSKHEQKLMRSLDFIDMRVTSRQLEYYSNAAQFLGLLSNGVLTQLAKSIFSLNKNQIIQKIAMLIKESIVFKNYFENNDRNEIIGLIKKIYGYSDSTALRRFVTVKVWIEWARKILKENY